MQLDFFSQHVLIADQNTYTFEHRFNILRTYALLCARAEDIKKMEQGCKRQSLVFHFKKNLEAFLAEEVEPLYPGYVTWIRHKFTNVGMKHA